MFKSNQFGAKFDSYQNVYRNSTNVYLDSVGLWYDVSWSATVPTYIRTETDQLLINVCQGGIIFEGEGGGI